MDVKTTFLNGNVEEEVYMKQPEGFVMACNEHKVCKLVKSLYGLKQAPKQKLDGSGKGVIIYLYVDDMLIFGTDQNQVDKTKKILSSKFSMKDMREADVILGRYGVSVPALTKDYKGKKPNTPYPEDQYAVLEIWNEYNILEDIKHGPYSKKLQYAVSNPLDTPYRTNFQTLLQNSKTSFKCANSYSRYLNHKGRFLEEKKSRRGLATHSNP
ncbi:zinc finger, CCHC-type containing protein [Tanacetum coccineum]